MKQSEPEHESDWQRQPQVEGRRDNASLGERCDHIHCFLTNQAAIQPPANMHIRKTHAPTESSAPPTTAPARLCNRVRDALQTQPELRLQAPSRGGKQPSSGARARPRLEVHRSTRRLQNYRSAAQPGETQHSH